MPYSSQDEMTTAVQSCVRTALEMGADCDHKISVKDIDDQLMTSLGGSPPLEVLVRTSGVQRLSDFMLWQVTQHLPHLDHLRDFLWSVL
jgi:ditrans,polycis-polyprenyl diphosphate synthase